MSSRSAWIYVNSTAWDPQPPTVVSAPALDSVARECLVVFTLTGAYELLSTISYNLTIPQIGAYVGFGISGVALSSAVNATVVPVKPPTLLVDGQQVTGAWTTGPSGTCASWSYETSWIDQAWPVTVGFSVPGPFQLSFFVERATVSSGGSTSTSSTSDSSSTSPTVPSSPTSTARLSARRRLGLSTGAIAGAVVAVVLVAIAVALGFVLIRRRRRRRSADLDPEPTATAYYAHEHATPPDPMPNRQGAVLSAPAPQANSTMREAKLARLLPPASDKASSSDYMQTPPPRAETGVDAAIPELYAAMRDAGFTVHTLLDHLRQRPQGQDEAAQDDEPHSEMLPVYEDPRRGQ